jgi:hypothetical protein
MYMDKPTHEYKSLGVFSFLKGPQDFKLGLAFSARLRRNYFRKMVIFFRNFSSIADTYFEVFFLQDRYISETYFLTIKRFWRAADKIIGFYTIS